MKMRRPVVFVGTAAAAALSLLTTVPSSAASSVPQPELREIIAYFGHTYVPGWLPPAYIFSRWEPQAQSATAFGISLVIDFGKNGDRLEWTVADPTDPDVYAHDACSARPFQPTYFAIGTRKIVFQSGHHGDTATVCLNARLAVTVWNGHTLAPKVMAKIAASATAD